MAFDKFQEENSPQVLDDDVGKDDLLGSASISMIGILQSQVGRAKDDLAMSIDLQGLLREMVRPGGVQVWRGSGVRAVSCCCLQRLLQVPISGLLQADIQGVIQARLQGAESCSVCQVGRDCGRGGLLDPWQGHHQRVQGKETGEKGETIAAQTFYKQ